MVRENFLEEISYEVHLEYFKGQRLMMKGGEHIPLEKGRGATRQRQTMQKTANRVKRQY